MLREHIVYRIKKLRKYRTVCLPPHQFGSRQSFCEVFGYTPAALKAHIERQFRNGMTWDRFLVGDIHLEHIIPCAQFDLTNAEETAACFALSNLRPMKGRENESKGSTRQTLL